MLYSLYFIKVTNYSLWISGCRSFGMWYSSMFFDELASTGSGTLKHLLMIFLRLSFWYLMRNGAGHCMNIVSCLGELLKKKRSVHIISSTQPSTPPLALQMAHRPSAAWTSTSAHTQPSAWKGRFARANHTSQSQNQHHFRNGLPNWRIAEDVYAWTSGSTSFHFCSPRSRWPVHWLDFHFGSTRTPYSSDLHVQIVQKSPFRNGRINADIIHGTIYPTYFTIGHWQLYQYTLLQMAQVMPGSPRRPRWHPPEQADLHMKIEHNYNFVTGE